MRDSIRLLLAGTLAMRPATVGAQTFRSADSVIRRMWQAGMEESQAERLAQVLVDSIGQRREPLPCRGRWDGMRAEAGVLPASAPAVPERSRGGGLVAPPRGPSPPTRAQGRT